MNIIQSHPPASNANRWAAHCYEKKKSEKNEENA